MRVFLLKYLSDARLLKVLFIPNVSKLLRREIYLSIVILFTMLMCSFFMLGLILMFLPAIMCLKISKSSIRNLKILFDLRFTNSKSESPNWKRWVNLGMFLHRFLWVSKMLIYLMLKEELKWMLLLRSSDLWSGTRSNSGCVIWKLLKSCLL